MRFVAFHLARAVGALLAVLLASLVLLAAVETGAWALFGISWAEASEIEGVLLIWFGLLGAVYGIHHQAHLGLEVLTRRLPARARGVIGRSAAALVAVFGVLLAVYGAQLTQRVSNTLPATGLSASVQYFPTVVCGALLAFFALVEAIHGVPGRRPPETSRDDARDD
ncbi:MAG: TRAP transporter small permease subunit [bacterium]|nr:TRAP transporter small permease subunit [bacterium]